MSDVTRKYICDCSVRCIIPTEVSCSTYYSHGRYRNALLASFGDFAALPRHPIPLADNNLDDGLHHGQAGDLGAFEDVSHTNGSRKRQRLHDSEMEEADTSDVCDNSFVTYCLF